MFALLRRLWAWLLWLFGRRTFAQPAALTTRIDP